MPGMARIPPDRKTGKSVNGRDRILAALRGEPADRVPCFDLHIDPMVIHALHRGLSYENSVVNDMDRVEWVDRDAQPYLDKRGRPPGPDARRVPVRDQDLR